MSALVKALVGEANAVVIVMSLYLFESTRPVNLYKAVLVSAQTYFVFKLLSQTYWTKQLNTNPLEYETVIP